LQGHGLPLSVKQNDTKLLSSEKPWFAFNHIYYMQYAYFNKIIDQRLFLFVYLCYQPDSINYTYYFFSL